MFVIQSTCYPANDHLMELLVTLDALKEQVQKRVTAVLLILVMLDKIENLVQELQFLPN